ncbi:MAG: hypothetical protein JOZ80_15400 [Acidobacteriaceae bacterium]|nr:hypothetical protein [Acidobacteriaceae bacterium]
MEYPGVQSQFSPTMQFWREAQSMTRQFSRARKPGKLTQQAYPALFGSARVPSLTDQHIRIRESPQIVGIRPGGKSIYRDKES